MKQSFQYPSLRFLQERITALFAKSGFHAAFPGSGCDLVWPQGTLTDVVLFGDALRVLLDCDRWPSFRNYRLWVLNLEHKQVLEKVFALPANRVGVIPRALLLKKSGKENGFPPLTKINFLFSGRPLPEKNLSLVCRVVQELQKKVEAQLHVFGTATPPEYQKFIPQSGWSLRPLVHGDGGSEWIRHISSHPVYLNLGLELTDDFCVSCADAEEAGVPVIVPDRGPYRELISSHWISVPVSLIRSENEAQIAEFIIANWNPKQTKFLSPKLITPEPFSSQELQKKFLRKTPYDTLIRKTFRDGMASPSHHKLCSLLELP